MKLIVLVTLILSAESIEKGTYIGCYKNEANQDVIQSIPNVQVCIDNCEKDHFKFALLSHYNTTCACNNFLGELKDDQANQCSYSSVYSSLETVPGRPKNFRVLSQTNETAEVSWEKPDGSVEIQWFEIDAFVLHTFSQYPIAKAKLIYPNDTFKTTIPLQPASRYNLTIHAQSKEGSGSPASQTVETLVGIPDNVPAPPEIVFSNGTQIKIRIQPVTNNNGPISYYRIVVLNELANEKFEEKYLTNHHNSVERDLNYYITAELTSDDIKKDFIVGDGGNYGTYFNAPLLTTIRYNIVVGVVSNYNDATTVAYSAPSKSYWKSSFQPETEVVSNNITTFLITSIIILSILLLLGIIGFILLRRRLLQTHKHNRLSEQELTLQGPMISVENSAYLTDEEQAPVNHYKILKQRLKIFNLKDDLSIDGHSIIGKGKFGTVCTATLLEDNRSIAAYTIPDKTLTTEKKRAMLRHLDMLIRAGKHDNIVELIGTTESTHMLYVLLEVYPTNLKQFLLNSRVFASNKFCKASELEILNIISQILQGLTELERNNINHHQLCARNIMLTNEMVPKIFGFGLADYVSENEPSYTRWTALEVLKGGDLNSRSPIWSFGVLLWEICALGGTPYSDVSSIPELIDKISKGTRLPQLKYFNDDVYQIMLNCWQVDMGERPDCKALSRMVENLYEDTLIPFVSFNSYQSFEYIQYRTELEFK